MVDFNALKKIAAQARLDIIKMIQAAGSGHPGGSLSIIDAITTLYFSGLMKYDPADPQWKDRDRFILSKGHCAPALYVPLSYAGFFPREDLMTLRKFGSHLQGHTDLNKTPGVESCGGPLGQGLSVGVGCAIAAMMNSQNFKTYVALGDGETAKGNVTEAAKLAGVLKLNNLIAFIDYNKIDQDGRTSDVLPLNFKQEWESYNWNVSEVKGYDVEEIYNALVLAQTSEKPTVVVLDTIKAKGVSFMEEEMYAGISNWHGKAPKGDDFINAVTELQQKLDAIHVDQSVDEYIASVRISHSDKEGLSTSSSSPVGVISSLPSYPVGEKKSTRDAFGDMLPVLGEVDSRVVILTAGVGGSVKFQKFIAKFGTFSVADRKGRFVQCGIAEANMAGVAAGLALCGKKPWVATFDIFMKEMLGVIRNSVCYAKLDVKFVGTHAGLGVEDDGGSHQSLLEPAIFADLPGIKCYEPADANETVDVMEMVWKENVAAYIRLTRQGLLILDRHYALEKDVGVYPVLVNEDLALQKQTYLIGSGAGVGLCLEAAQVLLDKGVKCSVLNVVGLGDVDRLRNLVKKNALVVTVHDAYCKSLAQRVSLVLSDGSHVSNVIGLGLQGFGESGKLNELYAKHGMDVDSIVQNVLNALV